MYNETRPNKIKIHLPTNNLVNTLSLQDALAYFQNEPQLQKYNISHLIPMNELINLLDISRSSVEINILKNENVRHYDITGEKLPKNRNYFDVNDIIQFLINYCNLTYYKVEEQENESYKIIELKGEEITEEDKTYLASLLIWGSWASSKQLETRFSRTRRIISRFSKIVDSITFSFAESQRHFRRVLLTQNNDYYLDVLKNYKKYEEKIIKG